MPMGEGHRAPGLDEILERDQWASALGPYESLGQRFRLLVSDAVLAAWLDTLYGPMRVVEPDVGAPSDHDRPAVTFRIVAPTQGRAGAVVRGDELMGTSLQPSRIMALLQWSLNRRVIETACVDRLVLHAGCVAHDGAALVLAGRMEAGKSTLTAGLLDLGFEYLTDEAVAVAEDLTVEGYAKPLSLDPGSWSTLPHLEPDVPDELHPYLAQQWQVGVSAVDQSVNPQRLQALVLTRYQADAPTTCEPAPPRWALAELAHCTFVPEGQVLPAERIHELAHLIEVVPAFRMVVGDLASAARAVTDIVLRR